MTTYIEVTKDEFLSAIFASPLNIHPSIVGGLDKETGYTSEWRVQNQNPARVIGKSQGAGRGLDRYWLEKSVNDQHVKITFSDGVPV